VDVPILCLWLVCFWGLQQALVSERPGRYYAVAGTAIALACLVKYTSLVLLPLLLLAVILSRRWRSAWALGIPLGALVAWSVFNYLDYGHVHLLNRPVSTGERGEFVLQGLDWLICLGAVAPFGCLYVPFLAVRRQGRVLLLIGLAAGLVILCWGI